MKFKFFTLFLLTVVFVFFGACDKSAEEFSPEWSPVDSSTPDFSGLSFSFGTGWIDEYAPTLGFSSAGDKMLARYDEVRTVFNTDFKVVKTEDSSSGVIVAAASGIRFFDFMDLHGSHGYNLYKGGYLYPLEEISTIDLSDEEKWSPVRFRQYGIYDGLSYGFYPWSWEFIPQFEGVLLFNNELVKKAGLESPYDIQERGDWTWQTFKEYLQACQNNLGENEIVPMVRNDYARLAQTAMMSNGVKTIVEKDGKYVLGYDSDQGYKALEFLAELNSEKLMVSGNEAEFAENAAAVFMSCESYLGTLFTETSTNLPSVCLEDYGMLPFPYGPDADPSTVSAYVFYTRRLIWTISTSFNDMDDVGVILNFIFNPLDGDTAGTTPWKELAENLVFHHYEGYKNFVAMVDNINYDYSAQLSGVSGVLTSAYTKVIEGSETAYSAFSSIRDAVQSAIDENVTWIYREDSEQ